MKVFMDAAERQHTVGLDRFLDLGNGAEQRNDYPMLRLTGEAIFIIAWRGRLARDFASVIFHKFYCLSGVLSVLPGEVDNRQERHNECCDHQAHPARLTPTIGLCANVGFISAPQRAIITPSK
jgi:hypothetical protein